MLLSFACSILWHLIRAFLDLRLQQPSSSTSTAAIADQTSHRPSGSASASGNCRGLFSHVAGSKGSRYRQSGDRRSGERPRLMSWCLMLLLPGSCMRRAFIILPPLLSTMPAALKPLCLGLGKLWRLSEPAAPEVECTMNVYYKGCEFSTL